MSDVEIASPHDPADGLAAVAAVRRLADQLENAEVERAMRAGWSWFLQAEDGLRAWSVTGVQACALPICPQRDHVAVDHRGLLLLEVGVEHPLRVQIGRASCRGRGLMSVGARSLKQN